MTVSGTNPKDRMGSRKLPLLSVVPAAGLIHEAAAMRYGAYEAVRADGGSGYGPYNWRTSKVRAMVYIDAILRHLMDWVDGENYATDSGVHHLGHAKASLGILLDAMECGTLEDDRPKIPGMAPKLFEQLTRRDDR